MRVESDSIGSRHVPADAYYGVQSLRGKENFPITGQRLRPEFICAIAQVKKACAICNYKIGQLSQTHMEAITAACDEIIGGALHDSFICDPIQGGAGTTANMNANEVIANRATELLGGEKGTYTLIHPNDHVNRAQSTNDVIPTAARLTTVKLLRNAIRELTRLQEALQEKEEKFHNIIKMGRTQMQDAVPIRLGAEFGAYARAISRDIHRLHLAMEEMYTINLGGTAVGTALNTHPDYVAGLAPTLSQICDMPLRKADDLIDGTQNLDAFAYVSAAAKTCAISCSKMANDLRLMSSGPRCGFEEINLPPCRTAPPLCPVRSIP